MCSLAALRVALATDRTVSSRAWAVLRPVLDGRADWPAVETPETRAAAGALVRHGAELIRLGALPKVPAVLVSRARNGSPVWATPHGLALALTPGHGRLL